jgi:hypothetical protein
VVLAQIDDVAALRQFALAQPAEVRVEREQGLAQLLEIGGSANADTSRVCWAVVVAALNDLAASAPDALDALS